MLHGMTVVAMIPARGGSKGLPGKNLMKLGGKSLIERAIDSTVNHQDLIDYVVVSSDDQATLDEATRLGAVAHRRSAIAAGDNATAADVLEDYFQAPDALMANQDVVVVYLQPTSPLRTAAHVRQAMDAFSANHEVGLANPSVIGVCPVEKSPYWTLVIQEGKLAPLFPEAIKKNRQDLPATYVPNGAIYMFRYSDFLTQNRVPTEGATAFVMDADESVDVDTQADFDRAAAILAAQEAE